ncbi:MAG: DUF2313 domain-containing protein [Gammaproteobacteria bacterium]|nr:DUF2313 domain-containing protein [Gammaproteobacteria bacterium]MCP4488152.1 DUF2313 domain-containing protein [Gammaproteobacteria bacterium]
MSSHVKESIFNAQSLDEATDTLGYHMPQGRAWAIGKEDSNIRNLLGACARGFLTVEELIEELAREFDISQTYDLIEEWEESVGIPNECILSIGDIQNRREEVIRRLRKVPIVTLEDMQSYVDELFPDDGIVLYNGTEYFSYEYVYEYTYLGDINERFIIVAEVPFENEFEYTYEYTYTGGPDTELLRCVLEKVIPANVVLHIEFITGA